MKNILLIILILYNLNPIFAQDSTLHVVSFVSSEPSGRTERIKDLRNGTYFLKGVSQLKVSELYNINQSKDIVSSNLMQADIIIYSGSLEYFRSHILSDTSGVSLLKFKRNSMVIFCDVEGACGKNNDDTAHVALDAVYQNIQSLSRYLFEAGISCYYVCPDYRLVKVLKGFIDGKSTAEIIKQDEGEFKVYSAETTLTILSKVLESVLGEDKMIYLSETKYTSTSRATAVFNLLDSKSSCREACISNPSFRIIWEK
jgi:hypothetical protein